MHPLTPSSINLSFRTHLPYLLLDASAFSTRYIGSLLSRDLITSRGGISLPQEIWHTIFNLLPTTPPIYYLARPRRITPHGDGLLLQCEIDTSALISSPEYIDNEAEILLVEKYLASPGQHDDPDLFIQDLLSTRSTQPQPTSHFFTITLTSAPHAIFLPDCLFSDITVPDLMGRLQEYVCHVCRFRDGHTICPGCTGGVASRYGAFMGCGVDLACPLCLGLDFMQEDKSLLQHYYWEGLPEEEERARSHRFKSRLKELGYTTGTQVDSN
ncbi:hypothetical protein BDR22DRAFT_49337 [Usnea florida]